MKNVWIKLIYVFDTVFHFSYVKTVRDRGIKLLKLRIRINFSSPVLDLCWVRLPHPIWCPDFRKKIFY